MEKNPSKIFIFELFRLKLGKYVEKTKGNLILYSDCIWLVLIFKNIWFYFRRIHYVFCAFRPAIWSKTLPKFGSKHAFKNVLNKTFTLQINVRTRSVKLWNVSLNKKSCRILAVFVYEGGQNCPLLLHCMVLIEIWFKFKLIEIIKWQIKFMTRSCKIWN